MQKKNWLSLNILSEGLSNPHCWDNSKALPRNEKAKGVEDWEGESWLNHLEKLKVQIMQFLSGVFYFWD
jgi:hypothetical protein